VGPKETNMGKKKWKRRAKMVQKNLHHAWQQAEDQRTELETLRAELDRTKDQLHTLSENYQAQLKVSQGLQDGLDAERNISAGLQHKLDRVMFAAGMYPPHLVPELKGVFEDVVGIVDGLLPERVGEIMFDDPKTVPDLRPQMRRLRNEAKRGLRIIEQESKPEAGK